jgi:hypothetical protein
MNEPTVADMQIVPGYHNSQPVGLGPGLHEMPTFIYLHGFSGTLKACDKCHLTLLPGEFTSPTGDNTQEAGLPTLQR